MGCDIYLVLQEIASEPETATSSSCSPQLQPLRQRLGMGLRLQRNHRHRGFSQRMWLCKAARVLFRMLSCPLPWRIVQKH
jgi:hypothetical protein